MNKITIDGVRYVPEDRPDEERLRLCIVDNRGLTFVGRCVIPEETNCQRIEISQARCVIRWGTTQHLAELASCGPRPNTKLGYPLTVNVAEVIAYYDCDEEMWEG